MHWWTLETTLKDLNIIQREHIAKMIVEGFTSGEIIEEDECER